jgi:hypothetical protein
VGSVELAVADPLSDAAIMGSKYRVDACAICGQSNPVFVGRVAPPLSDAMFWTCSDGCRDAMRLVLDLEAQLGIRDADFGIAVGGGRLRE